MNLRISTLFILCMSICSIKAMKKKKIPTLQEHAYTILLYGEQHNSLSRLFDYQNSFNKNTLSYFVHTLNQKNTKSHLKHISAILNKLPEHISASLVIDIMNIWQSDPALPESLLDDLTYEITPHLFKTPKLLKQIIYHNKKLYSESRLKHAKNIQEQSKKAALKELSDSAIDSYTVQGFNSWLAHTDKEKTEVLTDVIKTIVSTSNVNSVDEYTGKTMLHGAAQYNPLAFKLLKNTISEGSDILEKEDKDGKTPSDYLKDQ